MCCHVGMLLILYYAIEWLKWWVGGLHFSRGKTKLPHPPTTTIFLFPSPTVALGYGTTDSPQYSETQKKVRVIALRCLEIHLGFDVMCCLVCAFGLYIYTWCVCVYMYILSATYMGIFTYVCISYMRRDANASLGKVRRLFL